VNPLDMRTLVFGYVVTNILCVGIVVLLSWQSRDRFKGIALLVVDFIFQASALILIVLRGAIPDWISIVLSNTLVVAGAILGFRGQERFVEKKGPQIHNYLLLILFVFVHGYFTFVQPSLAVRNINIASALLLVCFQSVWLMWHRVEPGLRSVTFGVGLVNFLYCLVSVVRILQFLIGVHLETDYFRSGLFEALVLVSYQVLFIMLTYSLVLMVNKRLFMEIETQEEKFAKAFHSAPYAITITRPSDGKIVEVNETFFSITGYDRTEVM
jgi:PAS domain-containing protein